MIEKTKRFLIYDNEFKSITIFDSMEAVFENIKNVSQYQNWLYNLLDYGVKQIYKDLNYEFLEFTSSFYIKLFDNRVFEISEEKDFKKYSINFSEIESVFIDKATYHNLTLEEIQLICYLIDTKKYNYFEAFKSLYEIKNILKIK